MNTITRSGESFSLYNNGTLAVALEERTGPRTKIGEHLSWVFPCGKLLFRYRVTGHPLCLLLCWLSCCHPYPPCGNICDLEWSKLGDWSYGKGTGTLQLHVHSIGTIYFQIKSMIQSSARNSILGIYGWIQLSASHHWLILGWSNLPQYQGWSLSVVPTLWQQRAVKNNFQRKELPYFFDQTTRLLARVCVATIPGRRLGRRHQSRLDKVRTSDTATTVRYWQ